MLANIVAPGKLVLLGEYAVLDGGPAIVMAIDRGVACEVHEGHGIEVPRGDDRFVRPAIGTHADDRRYVFREHNPIELPDKPGFGFSAAACVAACIAVDRPPTDAYEIHEQVQGGGSGVDVAASIYGGVLLFERRKVMPLTRIDVVVVYSGQSASTAPRIKQYMNWSNRASFVQQSRRVAYQFLEEPFEALGQYRRLLDDMVEQAGLSYWTDGLRQICDVAEQHGGVAKPSGAGGGDCAIALFQDAGSTAAFKAAMLERGFDTIETQVAPGAYNIMLDGGKT